MKAVILTVPDEHAEHIARAIAALLDVNGYRHSEPAVIDWPPTPTRRRPACCDLHRDEGCCDPNDCGPCCENCPTCPSLARSR